MGTLGGSSATRAFSTMDLARKWRKRYKRGQDFNCFFHPDHKMKVSVKNVGPLWIEPIVIAGYVMLGIALCPCALLLLFVLWSSVVSPCLHRIEDAHLFEGRHPPNTTLHQVNRNVHGIHREASMRIDRGGSFYKNNISKMSSFMSGSTSMDEAADPPPTA